MSIPDLAALRALMDAVERRRVATAALDAHRGACDDCLVGRPSAHPCGAVELYAQLRAAVTEIDAALPAAQETLEQVETELLGLQGAYTMAADDNGNLRARLAQLEEALARYGKHRANCGPATPTTDLQSLCTCRLDAVLEGRDE